MSEIKKSKRKEWPVDCAWPEPIPEGRGPFWEEDEIDLFTADEETEELLDIKEYFDSLVESGRLNEDYSLNDEYDSFEEDNEGSDNLEDGDGCEEFVPEKGEDYWDDGFDVALWEQDLSDHMNLLKIDVTLHDPDPVSCIREVTGYSFINENLLRQAFTRRAFALEYGLDGCSEELEYLGDTVLNMVVTREIIRHFSEVDPTCTDAPFRTRYNEGELTRIREHFLSGEHLASRARELGLDRFILYGTGEQKTDSSLEDAMEALVGAVCSDCGWDMNILSSVADQLLCVQLSSPDKYLKQSYYDLFNSWHQKHFGCIPSYEVGGSERIKDREPFYCTLRFSVPENQKGISEYQRIDVNAETRSMARELAAKKAYYFVLDKGLWVNLADAGLVPDPENSINQLQELFQKKYVEQPQYEFSEIPGMGWRCECVCGGVDGYGNAPGKTKAKKKASFMVLVKLLSAAGLCRDEWRKEMWKSLNF